MKVELNKIATETRNEKSKNIDTMQTINMLKIINEQDKCVALAVQEKLADIACAVDMIYKKVHDGGRLIYCGAGTSGRLGVLDAVECSPTYGVDNDVVTAIMAGGNDAFVNAIEGAEDNKKQGSLDLKALNLTSSDALVGIAASGRTPYVIGALEYAKEIGATTISLTCSRNDEMINLSDVSIVVLVGPEVITGSTRMKSGTAQKMVLNMLSTCVMIKMGKVYENLMVDVKPTNEKLVERIKSIVCTATGVSVECAAETLAKCNNSAKCAILMIMANVDCDTARKMILENDGNIAQALLSK